MGVTWGQERSPKEATGKEGLPGSRQGQWPGTREELGLAGDRERAPTTDRTARGDWRRTWGPMSLLVVSGTSGGVPEGSRSELVLRVTSLQSVALRKAIPLAMGQKSGWHRLGRGAWKLFLDEGGGGFLLH